VWLLVDKKVKKVTKVHVQRANTDWAGGNAPNVSIVKSAARAYDFASNSCEW